MMDVPGQKEINDGHFTAGLELAAAALAAFSAYMSINSDQETFEAAMDFLDTQDKRFRPVVEATMKDISEQVDGGE